MTRRNELRLRSYSTNGAAVVAGDDAALAVGLAVHQRGDRAGVVAALLGVVREAAVHQQRAEVGVAQAERPIAVAVLLDLRRRVAGVVDHDLLRRDRHLGGEPEGVDVELAVVLDELHQVEARQVAGGVVEEHVLAARVGRVDPVRVGARMPVVDGGVVLDARVAAQVRGVRHLAEDVAGLVRAGRLAVGDLVGRPVAVPLHRAHEVVGHANAVVGVLEEDAAVGLAGEAGVIALLDEGPGLLLLERLAVDEVDDVRVGRRRG